MCRHREWIRTALQHARKSDVWNYKHCALLVKGGRIISVGINKNKCGCLGDPVYGLKGWHSELDVLDRINPEKARGATLYVVGISKGENIVCSKPCKYCQMYLDKYDLKDVYYSTPSGDGVERMAI